MKRGFEESGMWGILAFVEVRKGEIHRIGVNRNQGRGIRGRGERERGGCGSREPLTP